ncbi:hypothetical protein AC1031_016647 [Aphanomyces cochlioides]|nr:hypothetical protein AC1031_016647 [Aphanomyces cochlioides]
MARDRGHRVLYTPPYHSNLQPIELVWAVIKGEVGRQYNTETTFQDVESRLEQVFRNITPKIIHGCICAAESELMKLQEHLRAIEAIEDESDSGESDDGDSCAHESNADTDLEHDITSQI